MILLLSLSNLIVALLYRHLLLSSHDDTPLPYGERGSILLPPTKLSPSSSSSAIYMILGCIIIGLIALRTIAHDRLTTPFATSAPRLIGIENCLIEDKDAADLGYKIVVCFFFVAQTKEITIAIPKDNYVNRDTLNLAAM